MTILRRPARGVAALVLCAATLTACGGGVPPGSATPTATATPPGTGTPTATATPPRTVTPTAPARTPVSPSRAPTTEPSRPSAPSSSLVAGRYQPLWPFPSLTQARAWQLRYREGGHQPWHLDARQTALAFTRSYLGFKEIDRVMSTATRGVHARVGVGLRPEGGGRPVAAAVVHLVRFGTGPDAPWEVVGTDDDTLTLTRPAYGRPVSSPVVVGGRITGVDESVTVTVRQLWSSEPLGEYCCLPAGGENTPWTVRISFRGVPGQVVTVVASTGGHVAAVERFAVTGGPMMADS